LPSAFTKLHRPLSRAATAQLTESASPSRRRLGPDDTKWTWSRNFVIPVSTIRWRSLRSSEAQFATPMVPASSAAARRPTSAQTSQWRQHRQPRQLGQPPRHGSSPSAKVAIQIAPFQRPIRSLAHGNSDDLPILKAAVRKGDGLGRLRMTPKIIYYRIRTRILEVIDF